MTLPIYPFIKIITLFLSLERLCKKAYWIRRKGNNHHLDLGRGFTALNSGQRLCTFTESWGWRWVIKLEQSREGGKNTYIYPWNLCCEMYMTSLGKMHVIKIWKEKYWSGWKEKRREGKEMQKTCVCVRAHTHTSACLIKICCSSPKQVGQL